ncbi:MAG: ABC transporter substrate-binding protein [Chloroflexota bacterium]
MTWSLSRRHFIRTLAVAGAAIPAGLASACAPAAPAVSTAAPAATAGAPAAPKAPAGAPTVAAPVAKSPSQPSVQRAVLALASPNIESNKPSDIGQPEGWQLRPMYEYLTGVSPEGEENIPQLATSWSIEPDGKSYRFQLRKGVQFHRGKGEFTAKDVIYSWKHISAPDSLHRQAPYFRTAIEDIEAVTDYEVVFKMARPDPAFLTALGEAEWGFEILSKVDGESRAQWPGLTEEAVAGTGPYQYKERAQGQYIRFERVPYQHWRVQPDFPEFEYRMVREPSTRSASLQAREIHLAALPPELVPQAEQFGSKTIVGRAPGLHAFMAFYGVWANRSIFNEEILNADPAQLFVFPNTPIADVRVRRALNKAVNRDELNKAYVRGKADPLYLTFFHPNRPGWNPAWQQKFQDEYGYDPAVAKALLAEAGYGPGKPLRHVIILRPNSFFTAVLDMAEAIAGYWRAIGVEVDLVQMDGQQIELKTRKLEWDNHSVIIVSSVRQLLGFGVYNAASTIGARAGLELPETDEVYEKQIRVTLDTKKYDDLWRQLGDMAFERHMNIPLFWIPAEVSADPRVVADYRFPGNISGTYTHPEYIKSV